MASHDEDPLIGLPGYINPYRKELDELQASVKKVQRLRRFQLQEQMLDCVSKQISEETLDVLYGENVFYLNLSDKATQFINNISVANRKRIKYL